MMGPGSQMDRRFLGGFLRWQGPDIEDSLGIDMIDIEGFNPTKIDMINQIRLEDSINITDIYD